MKTTLLLLLLVTSINVQASGQRSAQISAKSLQHYPLIQLTGELPGPMLHYMGTFSGEHGREHLLMITRTSVSHNADGSVGMPWDSLYGYRIAADELEIVNGWDLDALLGEEGLRLRPSYCPRIPLAQESRRIELPADESVKRSCLEMRYRPR